MEGGGEARMQSAVSMTWLCCFSLNFVNSLTRFSLCRQQLREQSAHAALSPRLRFTLGLECSGGGRGWQTRNFRSKNFNRYLFLWGDCIKVIKTRRGWRYFIFVKPLKSIWDTERGEPTLSSNLLAFYSFTRWYSMSSHSTPVRHFYTLMENCIF